MFSIPFNFIIFVTAAALGASSASAERKGFTGKAVISGYFPLYTAYKWPAKNYPLQLYNHVDLFVTFPTANGGITDSSIYNIPDMQDAIALVHGNGSTVSLTLGGWTGSYYFSTIVADSVKSANLVNNIAAYLNKYDIDGIDIDWEYPGQYGYGNQLSGSDTANFLVFLQLLRTKLGESVRITLAVPVTGFMGPNGGPVTDLSGFAKVVDYVTIMVYDIYGTWTSKTGPNAPLDGSCGSPVDNSLSAKTAVALWTAAGFPASHLILGAPAYGHSWYTPVSMLDTTRYGSTPSKLYQSWSKAGNEPNGDDTWRFSELISEGVLKSDGVTATGNWTRYWDACSSTPFLFNSYTNLFISYDDAQSISAKAAYAASAGLAGINFFDLIGDTNSGALVKAARAQFVKNPASSTTPVTTKTSTIATTIRPSTTTKAASTSTRPKTTTVTRTVTSTGRVKYTTTVTKNQAPVVRTSSRLNTRTSTAKVTLTTNVAVAKPSTTLTRTVTNLSTSTKHSVQTRVVTSVESVTTRSVSTQTQMVKYTITKSNSPVVRTRTTTAIVTHTATATIRATFTAKATVTIKTIRTATATTTLSSRLKRRQGCFWGAWFL